MFAILNHTCILSTWSVPSNNEIICEITQSSCKRDTKSKSHVGMKLAPVRVFSCKHPLKCTYCATTGSPSALCVGSGFRGHLVEFGRSILELLVYYLMPNKCKNLKDMKSSCLSVCTIAFKITKVDISCIITCDSGPYCSSLITCIRIYNAKKKNQDHVKYWFKKFLYLKFIATLCPTAGLNTVSSIFFTSSTEHYNSVQYSMERKSTKRRLNRLWDTEWLWNKGKGTFWINISRDHDFFFLSVVDSNTCDKTPTGPESHVIMQEISTFVILKAISTNRQTRRLHIFKIFAFIWHQIIP